jgi:hypothetical protein
MRIVRIRFIGAAGMVIAALGVARAQQTPSGSAPATTTAPATAPATQPRGPDVITMTLRPVATTQPALAHKLLPNVADQTPGNAVILYLTARRFWPDQKTTTEILYPENERYDYISTPIDEFPQKYAERLLAGYATTLKYADAGARRREAQWEPELFGLVFQPGVGTDLDDLRHVENLLEFRARYQIAHGDWAGAEYTMQTGLGIARHLGTYPMLLQSLFETAFVQVTLYRGVNEWISRPGAPNLYWALTDLPRPFIPLQLIPKYEELWMQQQKPRLARAMRGELPTEQWPLLVREAVSDLQSYGTREKPDPARVEAEAKRLTDAVAPRARQWLAEHGIPKQKAESMSPDEAIGRYWCAEYRLASDEFFKAWNLPFLEAQEQMMRFARNLRPDQPPASENPLIQTYLRTATASGPEKQVFPILLRGRYELTRADQYIALLRTVEAVRDYAGRHDGQPPQRLDQITELPMPTDPVHGKPFPYRFDGKTAVIDAPAAPWRSPASGWRYELTVGGK